ncbi:MAG: hypothetical protein RI907_1440 [Pseudomonadota bacterium]|jgi:endonuclease/exonuclease/phosphatase (EEP) superfamily protein YafD
MAGTQPLASSAAATWLKRLWWLALATTLVLWAYLWWDPELVPDLAVIQYAPYPGYLVPVTLLALAMMWLGGRWLWLGWMPVLVVLGPVMGWCHGSPDEGSGHLRVMTYNIKSFLLPGVPGGYQKLAMEFVEADADIVMMQDAVTFAAIQSSHPDLYKLMVGDRQVQVFDQYAIVSRYPLKDCRPGVMPNKAGNFFQCQTTVHGQALSLITVHFTTPRDGLNATRFEGLNGLMAWKSNMSRRIYQSGYLAELVRKSGRPCIVAGDLNAPEHSRIVQALLHTGLRDAFSSAAWGWGYTHGHSLIRDVPFLRIDHILVSEDMGVERAWVGGMEASQHRPVVADLFMRRH